MCVYIQNLLSTLRWHWGSAYVITCAELGHWEAQRRDDHASLLAESPEELNQLMRADYTARPVPRELHQLRM